MSKKEHNNKENRVYLGISEDNLYPTSHNGFCPSIEYPEYIFPGTYSSSRNNVYDMVREGFYNLGYDIQNYNTKAWNPLRDLIKEGDTVLIKPNWVMHYNKNKAYYDNLECLVTHPSIVRAVIDYVLIALKNTGKVIVADAPMQGCDLHDMFSKIGYFELFEFYKKMGIDIEILDLRQCRVVTKNKVITDTILVNGDEQSISVDLGETSAHLSNGNIQYKVSDYSAKRTNIYHHGKVHTYKVNRNVLQANVIINMPKPKCHRLAGLTSALKNMVGITYDKASLPHRVIGAKNTGGDEYLKKSLIKALMASIEEKKLDLTEKGKSSRAMFWQLLYAALYLIVKVFSKDKILIGSWYGNDTIWRTVVDLNYIVRYGNKDGIIQELPQRKILNVADMIIAGQGNGPIGPYPKNLGMILIGEDSCLIDAICAKIMGFDLIKIPGLVYTLKNKKLCSEGTRRIISNDPNYNESLLDEFSPDENWRFQPHECWIGFIENY